MKNNSHVQSVHNQEPDYHRPPLRLSEPDRQVLMKHLTVLYGEDVAEAYLPELERILKVYYAHKPQSMIERDLNFIPEERFTEEDIILITYGDLLRGKEASTLKTLARFCDIYLEGTINTLHILPFFPYSSDRGFSITDFESVDPNLGTWQDIEDLESRYQLMFDGVFNHISSKSRWFQEFLNGNQYYRDFFIWFRSHDELSEHDRKLIFRPRTSDILTEYMTVDGPLFVWTTFSADQIDLNFHNPNVLMRIIEILLLYVRHGADILRLDAVTYFWVERGTRCIHLNETHEIVRLMRDMLDMVAPHVAIITETNVPHEENISYFGNGYDEAQMVYNFALPPLVLYTFYSGDATELSRWAETLSSPSNRTTFFNFLDSHDGIGLMGVRNILSTEQIDFIIEKATGHGGLISYKTSEDGSEVPYEVNITWYSALNREEDGEDVAFQVKRFVASRIISLIIQGVPGVYLHSLIGSENDIKAVTASHSNRDINRTVIDAISIKEAIGEPLSKIARIGRELGRLLILRTKRRAFHPNSEQHILHIKPEIFSVVRLCPEKDAMVIALVNVSASNQHVDINCAVLPGGKRFTCEEHWFDIISEVEWISEDGILHLTLLPYDTIWLEPYRE